MDSLNPQHVRAGYRFLLALALGVITALLAPVILFVAATEFSRPDPRSFATVLATVAAVGFILANSVLMICLLMRERRWHRFVPGSWQANILLMLIGAGQQYEGKILSVTIAGLAVSPLLWWLQLQVSGLEESA